MNTVLRWNEQDIEREAVHGIQPGTGCDLKQAPAPAPIPATDPEPLLYPQSLRYATSRRRGGERGLYPSGSYPSHPALSPSPSHREQRFRRGLH